MVVPMDSTIKTLTPVERLQLVNQFRILEQLYPDEAAHYSELRDIITEGYTIQYGEVFGLIFDEMPWEECDYVYDVLDMHRVLIRSFEALKDKEGLTEEDVKFQGFDGNNESKRLAFAEHLKKEGKWTETLGGYLNSHSISTMTRYPKMLTNFQPIRQEILASHSGNWLITAAQIKQIIS
jgi:uncharacterized protein